MRRFLALLPEFASLLTVMKRDGNNWSAILARSVGLQPSPCAHAQRTFGRGRRQPVHNCSRHAGRVVEQPNRNGSLPTVLQIRFLIILVKRSKLLPEGGGEVNLSPIVVRLHAAVEAARGRGLIARENDTARALWAKEYETTHTSTRRNPWSVVRHEGGARPETFVALCPARFCANEIPHRALCKLRSHSGNTASGVLSISSAARPETWTEQRKDSKRARRWAKGDHRPLQAIRKPSGP